jgi:hypothetical protein
MTKVALAKDTHWQLGRRGVCLFLVGAIWIMAMAWSVWHMPDPVGRARAPHEYFPPAARAIAWTVTGLVGMFSAFLPQGRDRWGFFALILMPAERACSWLIVLLLYLYDANHYLPLVFNGPLVWGLLHLVQAQLIPRPPMGITLRQVGSWTAVVIFLFAISGWTEAPAKPKPVLDEAS